MIYLRQPFDGEYPISLNYKENFEGIYTDSHPHTGIDYACPTGTHILAAADGTVYLTGYDPSGYGRYIIVRHSDSVSTLYAHLSTIRVTKGLKIASGDLIAYSGNTGGSTGPHLHFECRKSPNDSKSHFDPASIMQCVDSSVSTDSPKLEEGLYETQVLCWARNENLLRSFLVQPGEKVYVFPESKIQDNIRFCSIGAGHYIASLDSEGTVILKPIS